MRRYCNACSTQSQQENDGHGLSRLSPVRGYRHVRTEYIEGGVVFTIEQDPTKHRCPTCGGKNTILKGGVERRFRGLSIGSRKVTIVFRVPRIKCRDCNAVRQTPIEFADPRRTYIRSFAQYVLELARMMTIRDVALHLGVSWDLVKEIVKDDLQKRFARPKLKHLRRIAIDEISIGNPPTFACFINSPGRFASTPTVCWPTTTTPFRPVLWKAPTTKSKP
jgi:hypothetical protein